MPTGVAIARQVTTGDYDLVITSSTPSMQAVANNNREGKVRHIFFLVADPFASGIGLERENPLKHPAHIVGHGVLAPVEGAFQVAMDSLPGLKTVGVAWNPSESNSLVFTSMARVAAKKLGLTLLEANVDSTAAVAETVGSLISRGAQAIWVGGDNTVNAGMGIVIATAQRAGVPVFSVLP
jgi:putative ABC transport system substrate-binding protein